MKQVYESAPAELTVEGQTETCTFKVYRDYKVGRGKVAQGYTVVQSGPEMGDVPMLTYPSISTGEHSAKVFANTMADQHKPKPVRGRIHR